MVDWGARALFHNDGTSRNLLFKRYLGLITYLKFSGGQRSVNLSYTEQKLLQGKPKYSRETGCIVSVRFPNREKIVYSGTMEKSRLSM